MTQTNFKSAFLGNVHHPKNVIKEYLWAFKNKCQADILSLIDGWVKTRRNKGESDWVRLSASYLAKHLGYCKKTILTHLKKLVNLGVLVRDSVVKLFACDTAYSYTVETARLLEILGKKDAASEVNLPYGESKDAPPEEKKDPAYYIDSSKEINSNNADDDVSLQANNIKSTPPTSEVNQPLISDKRMKKVEALGMGKIFPALATEIEKADEEVFENAIALLRKKIFEKTVKNSHGFLMDALKQKYEPSESEKIKDRNARFTAWRKASPANDKAAQYSSEEGDRILISADGETWTKWELAQ